MFFSNSENKKVAIPIILIIGVVLVLLIGFALKSIILDKESIDINSAKPISNIDEKEIVKFGNYQQESNKNAEKAPIEWIVLDNKDGKMLLLSKYIIDCKCYNEEFKGTTWENCDLRKWLNEDFMNTAFTETEKSKIVTSKIKNDGNKEFGTSGGADTNDKIFCLSIDECEKYFGSDIKDYKENTNLAIKGTEYAKNVDNGGHNLWVLDSDKWYAGNSCFWLRNTGYFQGHAALVNIDGSISSSGYYVDDSRIGVRPALWVSY